MTTKSRSAMTAAKAKRQLARELNWHGITFDRLTARTVHLKSLGDSRLVVTVHGFVDEPRARVHLIEYGKKHEFGVEFREKGEGMKRFKVGDVVYVDGASAMLGDVVEVVEDGDSGYQDVTVNWRATTTTEASEDLEHQP